jgi:hypothetical protein
MRAGEVASLKTKKFEQPRRQDIHVAQPKYAERRRARPGAGIKRARAVMAKRARPGERAVAVVAATLTRRGMR